jgi:GTPase SAR1 family protein
MTKRKQELGFISDEPIKIVLLGESTTGKSVLFHKLNKLTDPDYQFPKNHCATDNFDFNRITLTTTIGEIIVDLWDTAGQENKGGLLRDAYLKGADGVLLLYDISEHSTIINISKWLDQIKKVFKTLRSINDIDRKKIKDFMSIDKITVENLKNIMCVIENTFDLSYIENMTFDNYKEESRNFIINNKYNNIQLLTKKIETSNNFMDNLVLELEKYIEEQNSKVIKKDMNSITLKFNDREGHYMLLTKRRCKILQEKLNKMSTAGIDSIDINGISIKVKDLDCSL